MDTQNIKSALVPLGLSRKTIADYSTRIGAWQASGASAYDFCTGSPNEANMRRQALRAYARATGDNIGRLPPARKIKAKPTCLLSIQGVKAILDRLHERGLQDSTHGLRDYTAALVIYSGGLRASELCNLTVENVNLEAGELRVVGKGNKERIALIGEVAVRTLTDYLRFNPPHNSRVFEGYSPRELGVAIKQAAGGLMIGNRPVHVLRHAFATHLRQGGMNIRYIQELLGHASIGTTQRYMAVSPDEMVKAMGDFHPRGTPPLAIEKAG